MPSTLDRIGGALLTSRSGLIVRRVDCDSPDFAALASDLDTELEARYPGLGEDEPSSAQDLVVAVVAYTGDEPVGCGALRELEPGVFLSGLVSRAPGGT